MEKITDELIKDINESLFSGNQKYSIIGKGANSICLAIDNNNVVLVSKIGGRVEEYNILIERTKILEEQGVNIGRIKDYKESQGLRYVLQTRVKGMELYSSSRTNTTNSTMANFTNNEQGMQLIKNAPQKHFDKYVSDLIRICFEQGLGIDFRHPDNLMYDEENGFYFIDMYVEFSDKDEVKSKEIDYSVLDQMIIEHITNRGIIR